MTDCSQMTDGQLNNEIWLKAHDLVHPENDHGMGYDYLHSGAETWQALNELPYVYITTKYYSGGVTKWQVNDNAAEITTARAVWIAWLMWKDSKEVKE